MTPYDRSYRLTIETWRGSQIVVSSDLRVTFRIEKNILQICQFGEIVLYNLNPDTETDILKNGKSITLEAGYKNGPSGILFKGAIRQTIRGKEDAVTYFLKLVCFDGDEVLGLGFSNLVLAAGQTAETIIKQIARSSSVPFDVQVYPGLNDQKTQRGKVVFGQTADEIRNITKNKDYTFYFDSGIGYVVPVKLSPPPIVPTLNAQTGMIGFPHQLDQGISVRSLINPALKLGSWIRLNNRDIIQAQIELGTLQTLLDVDGLYRIIELVITGDTRGNDWYFDITGYGQTGALPQMLTNPLQTGY